MLWFVGVVGLYIILRHNELRDLEAEMLNIVCHDVDIEPVLQDVTGETLPNSTNKAPDARVHARGFWARQSFVFLDVRVYHPSADSYKDLSPEQIYRQHENEKKRMYAKRVIEVEQGTFTPLVYTTTEAWERNAKDSTADLQSSLRLKRGSSTPLQYPGSAQKCLSQFHSQRYCASESHAPQGEASRTWMKLTLKLITFYPDCESDFWGREHDFILFFFFKDSSPVFLEEIFILYCFGGDKDSNNDDYDDNNCGIF